MKKLVLVIVSVIFLAIVFVSPQEQSNSDFLRIHIRADSNAVADQNVKYQVKQAVVEYLAPYLVNANTKSQAMSVVKSQLSNIQKVCDKVLECHGFSYTSTAKLCQESFPDRTYDGVTLPQGVYDSLIVELGSGSGDNWWCVVYPPLCFVGGESNGTNTIVFKSKLLEIIRQWKSGK